jgi:hypothetical protein
MWCLGSSVYRSVSFMVVPVEPFTLAVEPPKRGLRPGRETTMMERVISTMLRGSVWVRVSILTEEMGCSLSETYKRGSPGRFRS